MAQIKHLFPKMGGVVAFLVTTLAVSNPASALQTYSINWTGSGGYTLEGSFSYADNLGNTGAITFASLTPGSFAFSPALGLTVVGGLFLAKRLIKNKKAS